MPTWPKLRFMVGEIKQKQKLSRNRGYLSSDQGGPIPTPEY